MWPFCALICRCRAHIVSESQVHQSGKRLRFEAVTVRAVMDTAPLEAVDGR